MQEVRVAIVGMGIGKANALAISRNPRGRVVALCDLLEDRMAEFAKDIPGPVQFFTDYKEMCRSSEIDAVFVGTPNQFHVPVALEALRHDKHILVTKPLADGEEPARQLVEVAEASGLVNMMSLSTRFSVGVQQLGRMSQAGEFGELYYARARSIRRQGIPAWSLGFIQKGGGAFRDMGVHVLDSAWWLLGMPEPISVTGVAGAKFGPLGKGYFGKGTPPPADYYSKFAADDYGGGFIRFANGAGLQVESFWASHQPGELNIELFGTQAGAQLRPLTIYRMNGELEENATIDIPESANELAWDNLAGHFIASILDGTPCAAPLRHGWLVQRMMEGLLRSAQTGQEVRLA